LIKNETEYFYTEADSLVKVVLFEWEGMPFKARVSTPLKEKLKTIESHINSKLGKSITKDKEHIFWKTDSGIRVGLYPASFKDEDYYRIRIVIYKE
jgi:hypothetical protein